MKKVFPRANSGTSENNIELAESSRHRRNNESSEIPWNILVVSGQDTKKFRKCNTKYAKHHGRDDFNRSISSRMEAIQKTSDYETLKHHNRHYYNVSLDFSIFRTCLLGISTLVVDIGLIWLKFSCSLQFTDDLLIHKNMFLGGCFNILER